MRSEQARMAEEGQMERVIREGRDGRSLGGDMRGWLENGGFLSLKSPLPETTSRPSHIQINTKPVGSREGLADKEEVRAESEAAGRLLCYTEVYLGSRARPRRAKQAVTDL